MNEDVKDQLSWEEFYKNSKQRLVVPKKISEFNRLIAHSENFFIISGYGAFTDGYLLIISKELVPSFALVEKEKIGELNFLIKVIKSLIKKEFKRKSVVFEHGMCACVGGLDRAHIHIMSVSDNSSEKTIQDSIDQTLYERKGGIQHVEFDGHKLENIHDIKQILETLKNKTKKNVSNVKIKGKIFKIKDIKDLSEEGWPLISLDHVKKGGHYVYFESDYKGASFLTTHNFQTQFGREVVFYNELILNKKFRKKVEKIKKKNQFLEVWRWQNCMFESNIISTMKHSKKGLQSLTKEFKKEYFNYKFQII